MSQNSCSLLIIIYNYMLCCAICRVFFDYEQNENEWLEINSKYLK